jgi:hypothetical protein
LDSANSLISMQWDGGAAGAGNNQGATVSVGPGNATMAIGPSSAKSVVVSSTGTAVTGALTVTGVVSEQTASTPITIQGNTDATHSGVLLNTGATTVTTGKIVEVQNNGVDAPGTISGYGHDLYAYSGHVPAVLPQNTGSGPATIAFVASSNVGAAGTTTLSFTPPAQSVGYFGMAAIAIYSGVGTSSATAIANSACTSGWVNVGSKANSTPTIITTLWACPYITSYSSSAVTLSNSPLYAAVAFGAYSGMADYVIGNSVLTASGTTTTPTITSATQPANTNWFIAAIGDQSVGSNQTALTGNLRQTQAASSGVQVGLVDNVNALAGNTITDAVTETSGAWSVVAMMFSSGGQSPFGGLQNLTYGGSDATFSVQFESSSTFTYALPGAWLTAPQIFQVILANPYSAATANSWGASCSYIGTGTTPAAGGAPGASSFYAVVTGAGSFGVYPTTTFTPSASTYYNFMCRTAGLAATY